MARLGVEFWFYVLFLLGMLGLVLFLLLKYVVKEKFEIEKPYPVYYDMMKGVKYPYSGGPYYHDAPNWFDMWATRFTMWRNGQLQDPTYDNVLVGVNATVPMVPKQININGNKQTLHPTEKFTDVTSIYSFMDKPQTQDYDWSSMTLSNIPKNNEKSIYGSLDSPMNQNYDWSKFNLGGVPKNTTESIYKQLTPKC